MLNNVPLKSNMQQTSINNKTHLRFFFVRFVLPLWFTLLGLLLLFFLLLILSFLFLLAPLLLFPLFFFRARILPKRKWTKLIFRAKISRSHLGYLLSKCNEWRRAYCRRKLIKKRTSLDSSDDDPFFFFFFRFFFSGVDSALDSESDSALESSEADEDLVFF